MKNQSRKKLVIIDELFEKIEGHPYTYDKSVAEIFQSHDFDAVIYGHKNMLPAFVKELNAKPWFTFNAKSKIRKIPVLGAILYRTGFWKKYEKEIKALLAMENSNGSFLFFPNVYWYNILPMARALKNTGTPAALLLRVSIYDSIGLPKFLQTATLAIIKYSFKLLKDKSNISFFTDSEVIADEWAAYFKSPMKVLPIPHIDMVEQPQALPYSDKIRMYLPGGMRVEKGAQMLTEAFEILARTQPKLLERIVLVTQFLGGDAVLESYKVRLAALPVQNEFLKHLTTEEYNHQLNITNVILIPYQVSEGYRARTSGILAEAIAASKPFITTDGTWMSLQARKYDTGLIVKDSQADELAAAIQSIVNNYTEYSDKAINARDKWLASQSKQMFYENLSAPVEKNSILA